MENEPPGRRAGLNLLGHGFKVDLTLFELCDKADEVGQIAPKPMEPPDDEGVRSDGEVEVLAPDGERHPIDSTALLPPLQANFADPDRLSLTQSLTPQTYVRPLSLLSVPTVEALSEELGMVLNERRFRANVQVTLQGNAYAEDALVGRLVRIGREAELLIRERIPRCRFITYSSVTLAVRGGD